MQPYQIKKAYELAEKFQSRLPRDLYCASTPMQAFFAPCSQQTPFDAKDTLEYRSIAPGTVWGSNWQTGYFQIGRAHV